MPSDVILDDADVTLVSNDLHLVRSDTDDSSSTSVNLGNKFGAWHLSGPRSYDPGSPFAIFWHHLNDYVGPMISITTDKVVKIGQRLTSDSNGRVGIGTEHPETSLHVHGEEVHSTGPLSGYSFADRQLGDKAASGTPGQRWVLYASALKARLWSGSDKLVVDAGGNVGVGTDQPESLLHVHGQEIHSTGSLAGYSFSDRAVDKAQDSTIGERWVWYANKKRARLWSGMTDRLVVGQDGSLSAGGVVIAGGSILVPGLNDDALQPPAVTAAPAVVASVNDLIGTDWQTLKTNFPAISSLDPSQVADSFMKSDLVSTIKHLQARVDSLEAEVASLKQSQPAPV